MLISMTTTLMKTTLFITLMKHAFTLSNIELEEALNNSHNLSLFRTCTGPNSITDSENGHVTEQGRTLHKK